MGQTTPEIVQCVAYLDIYNLAKIVKFCKVEQFIRNKLCHAQPQTYTLDNIQRLLSTFIAAPQLYILGIDYVAVRIRRHYLLTYSLRAKFEE